MTISSYGSAVDETAAAIDRRAAAFRKLVIVVTIVALLACGWALWTRDATRLGALLVLLPVCGGFAVVDARIVGDWLARMTRAWAHGDIDFATFDPAVRAIPGLPGSTLDAMLATLPRAHGWEDERSMSSVDRSRVAQLACATHARTARRLIGRTIVAAAGAAIICLAAA